jgi:hypothetical protein
MAIFLKGSREILLPFMPPPTQHLNLLDNQEAASPGLALYSYI